RCRGRGSTAEIRSSPTGRPPSTAAALTASPIPLPENPNRVPVPRLPGPCVTTTTSAPSTCLAASRPECTLTASRSPPNACPQVSSPANVSDRSLSVRENHAGNAASAARSEEHTSELQSREKLVCRLLLEIKQ